MTGIVNDSSIWLNPESFLTITNCNEVKIGIVRFQEYEEKTDSFFYVVEALGKGRRVMMRCRQMSKFGDIFNYEEWTPRFTDTNTSFTTEAWNYKTRVGEVVIVAMIDGGHTDGVILGSLKHPGRTHKLKAGEYSYSSSYNGVETTIDKDGAWKLTFNGIPTNEQQLYAPNQGQLPSPIYDTATAGSFIGLDKEGSIDVNDSSATDPQSIKIDKKNGKISIVSGSISLVLDKKSKAVEISSKDTKIESSNSVSVKTSEFLVDSSKSAVIKSSKIAIGYGGVELIDSLIKIVDALGKLVINSPNGPCSPFQTAPTWSEVLAIKTKLNSIKGSL